MGKQWRTLSLNWEVHIRINPPASIGKTLQKIQAAHSWRIRYNFCKFGSDWSIIQTTLLEGQCAFSAVFWLQVEGNFLKIRTTDSVLMPYKRWKFGFDRSVFKGTLLEEHCASEMHLGFYWRDFPENSHLALSMHALQTVEVRLRSVNNYTSEMLHETCYRDKSTGIPSYW